MMSNRLGQPDSLPHSLAVPGYSAIRCIVHVDAFNGFPRQLMGFSIRDCTQFERLINEFVTGNSLGKGIKLRTIAHVAKHLLRIVWTQSQHTHSSLSWPDQPSHQVHERSFARSVGTDQTVNPRRQ